MSELLKQYNVQLTETQQEQLNTLAKENGCTVDEYVNKMILEAMRDGTLTKLIEQCKHMLNKQYTKLNDFIIL